MKKEFDISYSSPLLSLKPGQSKKAILSIISLVGREVSENFSCPILTLDSSGLSRIALRPSNFTSKFDPFKNERIVLLPTPVSPITITAYGFTLSMGIAFIPSRISSLSFGRLIGFISVIIKNIALVKTENHKNLNIFYYRNNPIEKTS